MYMVNSVGVACLDGKHIQKLPRSDLSPASCLHSACIPTAHSHPHLIFRYSMDRAGSKSPQRGASSSIRSGGAPSLRGAAAASATSGQAGGELSLNGNTTRMSPRPAPDAKDRVLPPASSLPKDGESAAATAPPSIQAQATTSMKSTSSKKSASSSKRSPKHSSGGSTPSGGNVGGRSSKKGGESPSAAQGKDSPKRAVSAASSAISEHVPEVVPTPVPGTAEEKIRSGRDSSGSASPPGTAASKSFKKSSPSAKSGAQSSSSMQKASLASSELKKSTDAAKAGMSARSSDSESSDGSAAAAKEVAVMQMQRMGRGFLARQKVANMQSEQDRAPSGGKAPKGKQASGVKGGNTSHDSESDSDASDAEGKRPSSTTLDVKAQARSMGFAKGGKKPVKGGSPAHSAASAQSRSNSKHQAVDDGHDSAEYDDDGGAGFESRSESSDEDEVGPDYSELAMPSRPYRVPMPLTKYRMAHKHSMKLVDQPAQTQEGAGDAGSHAGRAKGVNGGNTATEPTDVLLSVRPYVTAAQEEAAAAIKARLQQRKSGGAAATAAVAARDSDSQDEEGEDDEWQGGKVQVPSVAVSGGGRGGAHDDPDDLEGKFDDDDASHVDEDDFETSSTSHARTKGLRLSSVLHKYRRGLDAVFAHYSGAGVGNAGERAVARRTFDNMANHGSAMRLPAWLRFCREFGLTPGVVSKNEATQLWQDTSVLSRSGGIMHQQFGHAVASLAVRLLTVPREVLDAAGAEPVPKGGAASSDEPLGAAARHEVPFFDVRALVVAGDADPSQDQADMLDAITQARRSLAKLHTNGDRAAWFLRFFELHRTKDVHRRNRAKLLASSSGDRSSYIKAGFDRKPLGGTARTDGVLTGPGGEWNFEERGLQLQRIITIGDSATELAAARRAASGSQTPQIVRGADLAKAVNDEIMGSTGDELLLDLHHKRREQARMTNLDRREHKRRHQKPLEGVRVRQVGHVSSPEAVSQGTQRRALPKVKEGHRAQSKLEDVHLPASVPQDPTPDISTASQQQYMAPQQSPAGDSYNYGGYTYGQPQQAVYGQYDSTGAQYGQLQQPAVGGGYYSQPPGSSPQQAGIHTPNVASQQAGYGATAYGQQGYNAASQYGGGYQSGQYAGGYGQPQALSPDSPAQRVAASAHARAAAVAQAQAAAQQAAYAYNGGQRYQR